MPDFKLVSDFKRPSAMQNGRPGRLGKVEKFILVWVLQKRRSFEILYSRSSCLQAYHKKTGGLAFHSRANVRRAIPLKRYNSLQVIFTRALRRLEEKGYIQTYRVTDEILLNMGHARLATPGGTLVPIRAVGRRLFANPAKRLEERATGRCGDGQALQSQVVNWHRYTVVFRLTDRGIGRAWELFRQG